jgi:methionine sulfoxide reductase heme-binding subunit
MAGVKYRGLSPETRRLRWAAFLLIVGAVLVATAPEAIRTIAGWIGPEQESLPWYSSRVLGFLGYWALAASVIYGLALSTGIIDALTHRVVSFSLHQELSAVAIALVALHGAVLALDTFVQTSVFALIVPFAGPYEPLWVGIGQLAFYVMVAVYASFYFRKRLGQRGWRLLHYSTFLAFIGGTAHGVMAGTDTPATWAQWSYIGATVLVVFLLVYRIALSVLKRTPASRKEPA